MISLISHSTTLQGFCSFTLLKDYTPQTEIINHIVIQFQNYYNPIGQLGWNWAFEGQLYFGLLTTVESHSGAWSCVMLEAPVGLEMERQRFKVCCSLSLWHAEKWSTCQPKMSSGEAAGSATLMRLMPYQWQSLELMCILMPCVSPVGGPVRFELKKSLSSQVRNLM